MHINKTFQIKRRAESILNIKHFYNIIGFLLLDSLLGIFLTTWLVLFI